MSRKRKAFLGFYADVAGMIIVQLLSLLAIRFYLNVITLSDYGYWVVITSVIGWLGLADFGIGFSISRFLIKAMNSGKGETDGNEINSIAATSMLMFIVISFVFLLIGLLLIPFVTHWFHIDQLSSSVFSSTFVIVLISTAIGIPFALYSSILESRQKILLNRNIQTISAIAQVLSSMFFVVLLKSVVGLAFGLLFGTLLGAVLYYYHAAKEVRVSISRTNVKRNMMKQLFSFGGYFQLARTANMVATTTDSLFILSYLDASKVTVYNFTSKLPVLFCNTIASKIPLALFSGLSQVFDSGNMLLFKKSYVNLLTVIIRLAFFSTAVIFFVNDKFVGLLAKDGYGGMALNSIFAYWVFFETIIRGTGIIFSIYRELKVWAFAGIIEAILNIGMSFYFLHIGWGMPGLALATAIARTFTIGVYWAWFVNKKNLVNYQELVKSLVQNALRSMPMIFALYLLSVCCSFTPIFSIVIYSLVGLGINILFYDWHILYESYQKRSFSLILAGYKNKYF